MEKDENYLRAKKKVETLKDFYRHLVVYLIVNILLFAINFFTFQGYWWFVFPLGGWGIGLLLHALTTCTSITHATSNWEEKKINKYMEKDKKDK